MKTDCRTAAAKPTDDNNHRHTNNSADKTDKTLSNARFTTTTPIKQSMTDKIANSNRDHDRTSTTTHEANTNGKKTTGTTSGG